MEWEPKIPAWEMAELERQTSSMDCSVDLKLGGSGNSETLNSWERSATTDSSGTLKRPRAVVGGAACLVDGCSSDLSNCREYHRRHKVCEMHSKTPVVMVKGQEQRFCQQCSRFHLLMEFDDVKRSCRKRLDGHNRRRRKPQPDTINAARCFHRSRFPSAFSPAMMKADDNSLLNSFPAAEDGIHFLIGPDSACALSLLSSPTQYPGGATVAAEERNPMGQPLPGLFSRSFLGFGHVSPAGMEEEVEQTGGAGDGGLNGQGFFHPGVDGGSGRPSPAFPFSWQ